MINPSELVASLASNKKVFIGVVDDDPSCLALYEMVFFELGATATFYSDAADALELIPKKRLPNLLFVDFRLPNSNGEDFVLALKKKLPNLAESTLLVGFSQYRPGTNMTAEFEKMVDFYHEKPSDLDELESIIKKLIQRVKLR
jgi:CheY-like chemotaxis protein